ncbi:type II toxin-antitoxin system RelE/ParE family toxin [Haliscomenobacter sp.]|uniref:type II toxin-antitoxin system RelE/ParE family toxin n=1 Tax=Haliscomenobacter sp. TaxID=2717303 RepID=UPI003592F4ED
MSYNLVVLPEAREDILSCALWYLENNDSSGNLTDAFLDAVEQTLERLKLSPEYYSIRHDDVRGIHVWRKVPKGQPRRFPHIIFYRFQDPEILVIQVFPMKDDPEKLR